MGWEPLAGAVGAGVTVLLLVRHLPVRLRPKLGRLAKPGPDASTGEEPPGPLAALAAGLVPALWRANLAVRVERAGLAARLEPDEVAAGCLLSGVLLAFTGLTAGGLNGFLLAAGLAYLGVHAPLAWLRSRERARSRAVRGTLAGALDLMVACTEGGLGLAQAVELVGTRMGGPLGQELQRVARETAAGRPVNQALQCMARRLDLVPVSLVVSAVVRAEDLGTPVAAILRQQASQARVEQRQAFEREVAALPLKLTLCTVFFIFPTLFVLVVLPNVLWFTGARW